MTFFANLFFWFYGYQDFDLMCFWIVRLVYIKHSNPVGFKLDLFQHYPAVEVVDEAYSNMEHVSSIGKFLILTCRNGTGDHMFLPAWRNGFHAEKNSVISIVFIPALAIHHVVKMINNKSV
jgi:hypothetical protein